MIEHTDPYLFYATKQGQIYLGDSLEILAKRVESHSVDLIMTSPPFGLVRKKSYGNVDADEYLEWFRPFASAFKRVLKEIRMLTDVNDVVVDPFAGSCVTGEVCERLKRRWSCIEISEEYVQGALGRFARKTETTSEPLSRNEEESDYYKLARPGILWNGIEEPNLPGDGGKTRVYTETPTDSSSITSLLSEATQPAGNYLQRTVNTLWGEFNEDEEAYVVDEEFPQVSDE